jgi:hypothetical protein
MRVGQQYIIEIEERLLDPAMDLPPDVINFVPEM